MIDPHVVWLKYDLHTDPRISFSNPPNLEEETTTYKLLLSNGVLTVDLKDHFSSVEAARQIVDNDLRSWELDVALTNGKKDMWFVFRDAFVIDRNPPPPGSALTLQVSSASHVSLSGIVTLHVNRVHYPKPPTNFQYSIEVGNLWSRYENYLNNQEPLTAMAYFCLSYLEYLAVNRQGAARQYNIQIDVLNKLGELTIKGDERTARKADKKKPFIALSTIEIQWIEAAIKAIIRRVGEAISCNHATQLTMNDLPTL